MRVRWRGSALLALLMMGPSAFAGTATVYYYTPYKAWSAPYIHHNASGSWTATPGDSRAQPARAG
ncbi:carbohydrate binding domain-containing protein [Cystobacter fuscus]